MSTTIKRRILNVFVENDTKVLSVAKIAELAYGDAYIRDTRKHLHNIIKRNIYSVMELALQNDMIILPVRKKKLESNELEKSIIGYKLAGMEDADFIDMMLQDKEKRAKAYILSYERTREDLQSRNLLPQSTHEIKFLQ